MDGHDVKFPAVEMVAESLVERGWAARLEISADGALSMAWTAKGKQRLVLLNHGCFRYLPLAPAEILRYTADCHEKRGLCVQSVEGAAGRFWLACLDELRVAHEEPALAAFVQLMKNSIPCAAEANEAASVRTIEKTEQHGPF